MNFAKYTDVKSSKDLPKTLNIIVVQKMLKCELSY